MIDAGEHESSQITQRASAGMPGSVEPLEWLVEIYGAPVTPSISRWPCTSRCPACDQHTSAQRKHFEQLVDRDPESDSAKRKLNQCFRKMGLLKGGEAEDFPEENLRRKFRNPPAAKAAW